MRITVSTVNLLNSAAAHKIAARQRTGLSTLHTPPLAVTQRPLCLLAHTFSPSKHSSRLATPTPVTWHTWHRLQTLYGSDAFTTTRNPRRLLKTRTVGSTLRVSDRRHVRSVNFMPTPYGGIIEYRDPSVCLSHCAAAEAIGTLAACSLATAGHQRCADCGPVRGRT